MKRTALKRSTPLRQVSSKRAQSLRLADEPGRAEFKRVWHGHCAVCNTPGLVRHHHVTYEQTVRREGGNPWDLRNSLVIGTEETCRCHAHQHTAYKRIPLPLISNAAVEFAVELLGTFNAALYFASHYEGELT